jgi:prepilin-type N-terminal cleavage/methylation domain-containing protein
MTSLRQIYKLLRTQGRKRHGFSLVESIAVLTIAALIMVAVITTYGRVRNAAGSINQKLDEGVLPAEILQRIAEDIDRLATPGFDVTITVDNKFDTSGFSLCRMIIENKIFDKDKQAKTFERVVWQSAYDEFEDALIVYRSFGGMVDEDRVITDDAQRQRRQSDTELFVPLCSGVTFFSIRPTGKKQTTHKWVWPKMPRTLVATISFAEPFETDTGRLDVMDDDKIVRTIAIDRSRKIKYTFVKKVFEVPDPNDFDYDEDYDPNSDETL